MCIGVPMRVVSAGETWAWCEGRGERRLLSTVLIGPQPEGAWVLAFIDDARAVLSEEEVGSINGALDALDAALRGDAVDFAAHFPDLAAREPQLPTHLREVSET